ncbi:MAG: hypothetical protein ABR517_13175 [Thermoanaerobaculia bacterium]
MSVERRWIAAVVAAHLAAGLLLLTPGYIRPDSVAVYSWIRSIVFHGDLLFYDEWLGFGMIRNGVPLVKEVTELGTLANHWWVGTSMVSAPFYLAAHLVAKWSEPSPNGFLGIYAMTLAWVSVLFGAAASVAALHILRRQQIAIGAALGAIAAIVVGTPMLWYELRFPLGTHLAGIAIIGALCLALVRAEEHRELALDILCGLLFGLAVTTRLQHFVLAPAVAWHLRRSGRSWSRLFLVGLASLVPWGAQAVAWTAVYGQPLGPIAAGSSPVGGTWMVFHTIALDEVLFSSFHGLLPWSPVVALAVVGWVIERKRFPLATTLLLMFAGEWLANGLLDRYWWGGMSFGPRRFVALAVPLMIGLGWFLARTKTAGALAAAAAAAWGVALAISASSGSLDLSDDLLPRELLAAVASTNGTALTDSLARAALVRAPGLALSGLGIVVLVTVALWPAMRGVRRSTVGLVFLSLLSVAAAAFAVAPTRERAAAEIARFGIDTERGRVAGPLLDARGLLGEELRFLERRGREEEAARTKALIENIDQRLAEVLTGDQ